MIRYADGMKNSSLTLHFANMAWKSSDQILSKNKPWINWSTYDGSRSLHIDEDEQFDIDLWPSVWSARATIVPDMVKIKQKIVM